MFASSILGVVSTSTASAWARTLGISGGHNLLLLVKKIIVAILWSLGNYGFCKPMSHRCNSILAVMWTKQPRFCAKVGRKCSWTHDEMPAFRWKSQWQGLVALVNQNGGNCNGKTVKTKRNWLYTSDSHMIGYAEGLVTSINNVFSSIVWHVYWLSRWDFNTKQNLLERGSRYIIRYSPKSIIVGSGFDPKTTCISTFCMSISKWWFVVWTAHKNMVENGTLKQW
jgi:hypothetical protein